MGKAVAPTVASCCLAGSHLRDEYDNCRYQTNAAMARVAAIAISSYTSGWGSEFISLWLNPLFVKTFIETKDFPVPNIKFSN
jgi:hypothetical protein